MEIKIKKILITTAEILCILLITCFLLELSIRWLTPHTSLKGFSLSSDWFEKNEQAGLIHKANFLGRVYSQEYDVELKTNNEGFRSSQSFIDSLPDQKIIAVLGDSFVEAGQVKEGATFVKLLEEKTKLSGVTQVQNYGVGSTGLVHFLQVWRNFAKKHNPQIVLISVYSENDFEDSSPDFGDIVPARYQLDSQGKIKDVLPFKDSKISNLWSFGRKIANRSSFYQFLQASLKNLNLKDDIYITSGAFYEEPLDKKYQDALVYGTWALEELIQEIKAEGAQPVVLIMPDQREINNNFWQELEQGYQKIGRKKQLDRDKIRNFIKEISNNPYFTVDWHLNNLGHEIVSDKVAALVLELLKNNN